MPVFDCYRGHIEEKARQEEEDGHFVIKDLRGRDWLCYESSITTLAGVDKDELIKQRAQEMAERTAQLWTQGMKTTESACTVVECNDREELPRLLAASKDADEKTE